MVLEIKWKDGKQALAPEVQTIEIDIINKKRYLITYEKTGVYQFELTKIESIIIEEEKPI